MGVRFYQVREGDSWATLARKWSVPATELASLNKGDLSGVLMVPEPSKAPEGPGSQRVWDQIEAIYSEGIDFERPQRREPEADVERARRKLNAAPPRRGQGELILQLGSHGVEFSPSDGYYLVDARTMNRQHDAATSRARAVYGLHQRESARLRKEEGRPRTREPVTVTPEIEAAIEAASSELWGDE
jgi:hypothetical protein